MGSRRIPTLYKLAFGDDTKWSDFEITLRGMSIKERRGLSTGGTEDETDLDVVARLCRMIERFGVSWNREDGDGKQLPLTVESLEDEEPPLILAISTKWQEALSGVPAPLESGSLSGEISPVESILAEIPSESLAS